MYKKRSKTYTYRQKHIYKHKRLSNTYIYIYERLSDTHTYTRDAAVHMYTCKRAVIHIHTCI